MKKLILEGVLGEKFGREHRIGKSVKSFSDALRLVEANNPGLKGALRELAVDQGVDFIVKTGEKTSLSERELNINLEADVVTLIPVPAGAGKLGEIFKIIVGVVLLVVAYLYPPTAPFLIPLGTALISSGLTNLLMPDVNRDENQAPGGESYLFQGAAQNSTEGQPVPVLYGRLRVGGRPIGLEVINGQFGG